MNPRRGYVANGLIVAWCVATPTHHHKFAAGVGIAHRDRWRRLISFLTCRPWGSPGGYGPKGRPHFAAWPDTSSRAPNPSRPTNGQLSPAEPLRSTPPVQVPSISPAIGVRAKAASLAYRRLDQMTGRHLLQRPKQSARLCPNVRRTRRVGAN